MTEKNFKVKKGLDTAERIKVGTGTSNVAIDASSFTDSIALPRGTSGQRPGSAANGHIRFNTTSGAMEIYIGSSWYSMESAADTGLIEIEGGGTGANNASDARTNLGLGALAVLDTVNNDQWSGTDLAVANGGTGASDASTARTNLGLGALAVLAAINNSNWSGTDLAIENGGTGASTAADARTALGLGALALLATINNDQWSGTDLAVANGGTGSSTAAGARTNLDIASFFLALTGGTMAGNLTMADYKLIRANIQDYAEQVNPIGSIGGGTQDIDLTLGNVVTGTVDTSTTTFTFSAPPASGTAGSFTLILTNGGSQTVNWPASVDWADGAPTLTTSGIDILSFFTIDAGTTWYGFVGGLDFS